MKTFPDHSWPFGSRPFLFIYPQTITWIIGAQTISSHLKSFPDHLGASQTISGYSVSKSVPNLFWPFKSLLNHFWLFRSLPDHFWPFRSLPDHFWLFRSLPDHFWQFRRASQTISGYLGASQTISGHEPPRLFLFIYSQTITWPFSQTISGHLTI